MSCRKNYRDLDATEIARLVSALYTLKANGIVDQFANQHDSLFFTGIHHSSHFLPWHRDFLRRFEDALQAIDARITLPYWNSTVDHSESDPLWADSFLGQFDDAWGLNRSFGGPLPAPQDLTDALGMGSYGEFWHHVEDALHNAPHNWVGGVMASTASPGDPVFYFHHAWIDLVWAEWQLLNPGAAFESSGDGFGLNDPMRGVTATPADVLDHRAIALYEFPATFTEEDPPQITPEVTEVHFLEVPEGETRVAAAVFGIDTCDTLHFTVTAGPILTSGPVGTQFGVLGSPVPADPKVDAKGRVFFTYVATSDGDHATADATVQCDETGESFAIHLIANTIARKTAAIVMVLDQSNSMNFESGIAPGVMRKDVLQFSAPTAVIVLDDAHAAAVCTFDQDAHAGIGITPASGAGKIAINAAIAGYQPNPNGWTSIGEGVAFAQGLLAPNNDYDIKAMVVLTDGQENHGSYTRRYISDVTDLIASLNGRVYAIGLGRPEVLNPTALEALCSGNQGYMLLTGDLTADATYRLAKYYQQILAGVTNHDIVLDPDGFVGPGIEQRIPFWLNEADITAKCVLLTPYPHAIRYVLETPDGDIIDPAVAAAHPMVSFGGGGQVALYRVGLPIPLGPHTAHAGRWYARLSIDEKDHRVVGALLEQPAATAGTAAASVAGLRYSFTVQAYSNLRMSATLGQDSNQPGATLTVRAVLTEYGLPVAWRATCRGELVRPDGTATTVALPEVEAGVFEVAVPAAVAGIYRMRVVAEGSTMRGRRFTREQTLTGAVWKGGDAPPPSSKDDPNVERERWCRLIACVLGDKGVQRALASHGVDLARLRRCLELFCHPKTRPPTAEMAARLHTMFEPEVVKAILDALEHHHGADD